LALDKAWKTQGIFSATLWAPSYRMSTILITFLDLLIYNDN